MDSVSLFCLTVALIEVVDKVSLCVRQVWDCARNVLTLCLDKFSLDIRQVWDCAENTSTLCFRQGFSFCLTGLRLCWKLIFVFQTSFSSCWKCVTFVFQTRVQFLSDRFETVLKTLQLWGSDKLFFMLKTLQLCVSDKLFFVYTSGTTGLPKAAVVTHTRSVQ